jgi:hypothetical protein
MIARCKYPKCMVDFEYQPNKKYCEVHKEVRELESRKNAILKNQQKRLEEPLYEIQCKYCKKSAMSITGAKKYCSNSCRTKYFNLKSTIENKKQQIEKYQKQLEGLEAKL